MVLWRTIFKIDLKQCCRVGLIGIVMRLQPSITVYPRRCAILSFIRASLRFVKMLPRWSSPFALDQMS